MPDTKARAIMRIFIFTIALPILMNGCSDPATVAVITKCPDAQPVHSGQATFYTFASGAGACMFDTTWNDLMVLAMNRIDFDSTNICGGCATVTGPKGTITVRIVDLCPECPKGNIDLSPSAFAKIADTSQGRVAATWKIVSCNVEGPILYRFKEGSNQWWTAVQVRNHLNPIARLEYLTAQGTYKNVKRAEYNYFIEPAGMDPGPFTFRVIDIYNNVLIDSGIVHIEKGSVPGHAQFKPCSP